MRLGSGQFARVFHTDSGTRVIGQISGYPQESVTLLYPLRRLIVPKSASVSAGMEVVTVSGERYLVADEGRDYLSDNQTFTLIRLLEQDSWTRTVEVIDGVTKLPRDNGDESLGQVWYQVRTLRYDTDVLQIPEARYELICGASLEKNDRLGLYQILNVESRLGVTVAQVR